MRGMELLKQRIVVAGQYIVLNGPSKRTERIIKNKLRELRYQNIGIEILHSHPAGKGTAIRKGIDAAHEAGYDAVVMMDGDGQYDMRDVQGIMRPIAQGRADISVVRLRDMDADGPLSKITSYMFPKITETLFKVSNTQHGFKAATIEAALDAYPREECGFDEGLKFLTKAKKMGHRIVYETDVNIKNNGDSTVDTLLLAAGMAYALPNAYLKVERNFPRELPMPHIIKKRLLHVG